VKLVKKSGFGLLMFSAVLLFAGLQASAQTIVLPSDDAEFMKKPARIDILEQENDISNFVVGAVMKDNDMLSYCLNISDAATEARNSILQKMMADTEAELASKLAALEEKTALLAGWVNRRDKFMRSANKSLVAIFETMRPDAAASQISELDVGLAAAIILKLQSKISSAIMAEIKPKHAAKITSMLTSAIDDETTTTQ